MNSPVSERGFIGCLVMSPVMTYHVAAKAGVTPDWFVDSACRKAWETIAVMQKERVDAFTVEEEAGKRGFGITAMFLSDCVSNAPEASYAGHWLAELRKCYLRRRVKEIADKAALQITDPDTDPDNLTAKIQMELHGAVAQVENKKDRSQVYAEIVEHWEAATKNQGVCGLPTAWPALQKLLGGYRPGKVYIFGARPAAGKSTFMMNEAYNLAAQGYKVSIASIEMDEHELRGRILATACDKSSFSLDTGFYDHCDFNEIKGVAKQHVSLNININDDPNMPIEKLVAWGQFESIKHETDFIAIDYLQIISSCERRHESRNMEVTGYMRRICELAKSINKPVLVLSQLSRVSAHDNRAPSLQDLRDSGSIEQDAYGVIFIHHETDEVNGQKIDSSEFILAKNRGGPTGVVPVRFERNRQQFVSI